MSIRTVNVKRMVALRWMESHFCGIVEGISRRLSVTWRGEEMGFGAVSLMFGFLAVIFLVGGLSYLGYLTGVFLGGLSIAMGICYVICELLGWLPGGPVKESD